jgi:hypothetical protein
MIVRPTKQQREALLAFCQCQTIVMSPQPSLTVGLLLGIVQIVNRGAKLLPHYPYASTGLV